MALGLLFALEGIALTLGLCCWLKGAIGDAPHALSCVVGYNLRWLMRAVLRLGL